MTSLRSTSTNYYRPPVQRREAQHKQHSEKQTPQNPQATQQGYIEHTNYPPPTTAPPATTTTPTANPSIENQAAPFASVSQQQHQQTIKMGNILKDVDSTMDALGVDETIRGRVHKYLVTIEDQATHQNPSKRHIQESLKVIGGILDGFITDALKQPSNVVGEWVDALLLQPIEYHDPDIKHQPTTSTSDSSPQSSKSTAPPPTTYQATPQQHQQWRQTIKASKSALKYGRADEAATQLLQLVGELETHGETALLANTLTGLAKAYKHTGQTSAADTALQTAAQLYTELNEPHKAILQWRNLSQLYIEHGQPNNALSTFKTGSQQAQEALNRTNHQKHYTDVLKQAATLHNDWASHLFSQNQINSAKQQLKTARQMALQPKGPKSLLPDIYSNLSHVFMAQRQGEKAERALLQSMKAAQKLGDESSYQASWQQLQQLYAANA